MLTLAAALAIFAYALTAPLLGALLPFYSLTPPQQGTLGLANALGLVIGSLAAGPAVDSQGKKPVLLIGLGLLCAALLAAPNVRGYASLSAAYFTLGLGGGTVTNSANSLVSDLSPRRRGPALNVLNLFFGLGGIVTTFAASYVFKPAALFHAVALIAALALLANAVIRKPSTPVTAAFHWREVPVLFAQPTLLLFSLLLFLYVACEVGVWNWLKIYLIGSGFQPSAAGGIVSYGFALGLLLGRLAAARILIRSPAIYVVSVSGILIVVTTLAMLRLESKTSLAGAVFCAGFAMAPVFPTALSMIGNRFPRGAATAMGIAVASGWLGLAISSPVIGIVAAASTLRHALMLLPLLASAMVLVSLVLWSALLKTVTV